MGSTAAHRAASSLFCFDSPFKVLDTLLGLDGVVFVLEGYEGNCGWAEFLFFAFYWREFGLDELL